MSGEVQPQQDLPSDPLPPVAEGVAEAVAPEPEAAALPTLGEMMIAARERWNFSAGDVARQLRLGLSQVEALEANRFEALPGNTFVRGFIRNYAKAVQADPAGFIEAYERSRPQIKPPEIVAQTEHIDFMAKPIPKWVWYASGTAIAAVLLPVLIYLALQGDEPPAPSTAQIAAPGISGKQTGAVELSLPMPAPQIVSSGETPAPAAEPAPSSAPEAPPRQPEVVQPGVLVPPAALANASGSAAGPTVKIKFVGDAWVEILDKSGKKIYSQLSRAGSESEVQGQPPLSLVVGDASKVRITYNGKPVDLTPHVKKTVARLTLE